MSDRQNSDNGKNSLLAELSVVRTDIDAIDAQLLDLLNRRARCAQQVGEIKARHGDAGFIYRPEREAQVLRRIQDMNQGPLSSESVTWFFREVMSACLSLEQPLGIAFLGPLGTFSESASTKPPGSCPRPPSTTFSAKWKPAMPTTAWRRWKIPPKVPSAAPWTCCSALP
jgi:chorismate mutase/prephenate dehydratase